MKTSFFECQKRLKIEVRHDVVGVSYRRGYANESHPAELSLFVHHFHSISVIADLFSDIGVGWANFY